MIKTHKPRGHFWSCPSVFQQSKEIRNIRFEDCTPPKIKVLTPDPDDELPTAQRAAKRRRIEKLANDFLNGEALVITSARPHPNSLRAALEGNERRWTGAKYSLPEAEVLDDESTIWEDVDTPAEAAEKAVKARQSQKEANAGQSKQPQATTTFDGIETVTEETASSACNRERRVKAVKVSLEPSTEAVKQAAALRDRRLQRTATEIPRVSDGSSSDRIEDSEGAEPRSEPGSLARPRYFRSRKPRGTEWLLRRQTTLFELRPDESVDELNRTGFDTPSRSTQASAPLLHSTSSSPVSQFRNHGEELSEDAARGSYHTAPEVTDGGSFAEPGESPHDSQADSQMLLLGAQSIHAAPRRSRSSLKDTAPTPAEPVKVTDDSTFGCHTSPGIPATRPSLQESSQHAGKAKKGERARSEGGNMAQVSASSNRRRTAPSESQKAEEPRKELPLDQRRLVESSRAYIGVAPGDDASPFMFRKAKSKPGATDGVNTGSSRQQQKATRRPAKFTSSQDVQHGKQPEIANAGAQAVSNEAPAIEMSFGNNDSFAPKLHMALVDEHLNTVLPTDPASTGGSSAVKRALRREMRDADPKVTITRVSSEAPPSQVESLEPAGRLSSRAIQNASDQSSEHQSEETNDVEELQEKQQAQTQWPGTQALLHQAHQDFFSSPVKAPAPHEPTVVGTPALRQSASQPTPSTVARPPLRETSQEQLPATQTLMAGWSPWSTIKKPKGVTSHAAAPSPTVAEKGVRNPISKEGASLPELKTSLDGGQRRSSLRFSTSVGDSPRQSYRLSFPVTKPASQERDETATPGGRRSTPKSILRNKQTSQSTILPDLAPATWDFTNIGPPNAALSENASTEGSTDPAVSSYQCAQPGMFRDDSQLDQTIDELTASVLFDNDMDGVLSQV